MCAFESSSSSSTGDDCDYDDDDAAVGGGAFADDGNDHPASLRSLVRALVAQKRETYQIIRRVWHAYDRNVRPEVVWTRPDGVVVQSPAWSLDSIKTHLLTAPEFHTLFLDCVENVFTNIVMAQNTVLIDRDTGAADPEAVEAFLKTVKAMCAYKESRARLRNHGGGGAGSRPARGGAGKRSR